MNFNREFAARGHARVVNVSALTCVAALAAAGLLSAALAPAWRLPLVPGAFVAVVAACLLATVLLLVSVHDGEDARPVFILAAAVAASGSISACSLFGAYLIPGNVAAMGVSSQAITWTYLSWHLTECAGVFAYVVFRRGAPQQLTAAFSRLVWLIALVAVAATEITILLTRHQQSRLDDAGVFAGSRPALEVVLLVALTCSAILVYQLQQPSGIDRAVALAQCALTFGVAVTLVSGDMFTMAFYCARALQFAAPSIILVAAWRRQRAWERNALDDARNGKPQSTLSAIRVRVLAELATLQAPEEQRYSRMLELASVSIRPGTPMRGTLSHLDGDALVYDAVAWTGTRQRDPARKMVFTGSSFPFEHAVQGLLHSGAGTLAWDDVAATASGSLTTAKLIGTRAMIGTAIEIGRRTHFVVFSSPDPAEPAFSGDDIHYVQVLASFFSDTFQQRLHFEQLCHQMDHDALTGLENRVQFRKAVRAEITTGKPFAVALLNLDHFRNLNDVHGQMICDEVLVEIAYALGAVVPDALPARLHGDEFGILLRRTDITDVEETIGRVLDPFRRPFHTGDREGTRMLSVSASLGCAVYPTHGTTPAELLRSADVALAVAKEQGGRTGVVFDMAMKLVLERRRIEVIDIERAIAKDQFRIMYQPTFDLRTRELVGAEALIRWDHPERGEILPVDFIPAAERSRQIGSITRWVLSRVGRDALSVESLPPGFRIFFNLSAQNFDDLAFLEALSADVAREPRLGDLLGIEITETTAMQNVERSLTTLGLIRSLGLRIAIDDFGTGYSSLSYLKRLPVDMIKIDRSFVMGLPHDVKDAVLAETMIDICHRLDILSLAEGIETEAQRTWLAEHGCRFGQGYLIDRPLSFEHLSMRLDKNEATR